MPENLRGQSSKRKDLFNQFSLAKVFANLKKTAEQFQTYYEHLPYEEMKWEEDPEPPRTNPPPPIHPPAWRWTI